ncbi:MAG: glutaredoxin domain-containing protein [Methylococcales bacterium]
MSKTTVLLLIALFAGVVQNHGKIKRWLSPLPPSVLEAANVVLYSTRWCIYCAKTRSYFAANNIKYRDIDVELTVEGRKAYLELGGNGVPIVLINNNVVIEGYAPDEIDETLRRM